MADALHLWMTEQRKRVPEGSATIKAIDYSLGRWQVLTRYIDDGELPADNKLGREPDPADRHRAKQLAVRQLAACG